MTGSQTIERRKESAGIFDLPINFFSSTFYLSRYRSWFGFVGLC